MGWTTTHKDKSTSAKQYIEQKLMVWTSDVYSHRVLDGGVVKFHTYYGAVERVENATGEREVFAVVILLSYHKNQYHNFGYKDMCESMGPVEAECPERILKLLTPTDCENANDWRERCWNRINTKKTRPKIVENKVLKYQGKIYLVLKTLGRRGYSVECEGMNYRMNTAQAAKAEIVA